MVIILRFGSRGPEVQHLQELLNKYLQPIPNLSKDGDFGPRTEAAVRLYQVSVGLGIDGIVGPRTWASLQQGFVFNPAHSVPISAGSSNAPWMAVAMKEIGQREVRGAIHNPRVIDYHATTILRALNDETAWCSSFVNWCLQQVGIGGTKSAAAASWLNWGKKSAATEGAIAIIYNSNAARSSLSTSGNHVGFLVQETANHYRLLGGNQSNQVKISSYPKSSWNLKGFRWPNP